MADPIGISLVGGLIQLNAGSDRYRALGTRSEYECGVWGADYSSVSLLAVIGNDEE